MARAASLLPPRGRPRLARALGAAAMVIAAVAACSNGQSPAAGGAAPAASGAFPATISHSFGETTIPAEPKRVVAVGFNEADFVLSLGVVPVGVRDFIGEFPEETRPWAQDALGGAKPEVVGGNEINFEKVAALKPDLIMGVYSFMDRSTFDTLSKIAPTIPALAEGTTAATWQEQTRITGKALGRAEKAEEVIAATEKKFADARAANPSFEGKSVALDFVVEGTTYKLGTDDLRAQVFDGLGLEAGPTTETLSDERLSELDKDVVVVVGVPKEALAGNQVFQNLTAVKENRVVYLGDYSTEFSGAIGFGSPLSLPYAIDIVTPQLASVLGGSAG
ncbi:iron-siderophore ABC transporter substrate-binding protein [Pseudonocardia bannensis]|uniref:Iron-siderophore ABC transporter substrate-binding protein n=1 Tax=Pseudonocardia bannensis TaxID=630973 RepID=A0A848DKK6_9PSEU|nr:iron-siderophore ABC transporter substrate-binding protein [Pseudonocardia bannensis]NMH93001.1 iron-siderophore ABC transporter substrate-binding protein [Pseudonocardia bannensis]